tara:strand:- start:8673 stop:9572 length:900 start_codon:yes stop_codon:yes gene_type:complete
MITKKISLKRKAKNYYKMDPYKVLKVDKNCTVDQLRQAFKRVASQVHPDKGGNEEMFNIVVESYKTIFNTLKGRNNKDFNQLKNDSQAEFNVMKAKKHVSFKDDLKSEKFQAKFNRIFDDNRFGDPSIDDGYGYMMTASSAIREDINVGEKLKNFSDFNSVFDNQETINKEITLYKEPEALVLSKKLSYNELGVDRVDDYSSESNKPSQLAYCDYMKAHTTNKLIDKNHMKKRQGFKNMDDIETKREGQSFALTEEDKRQIEEGIKREKQRERQRAISLKENDRKIEEHFNRVNKLMLS